MSIAKNFLHQSNDEIEYFKIEMHRPNMDNIPCYPLPSGYSMRLYQPNSNDQQQWAKIATAAGEFHSVEEGEKRFDSWYLSHPRHDLLAERLYFLLNSDGEPIGTATAWFAQFNGEEQGSLEWVSIIPAYQGKKLAKPMISTVLHNIAQHHKKCSLQSQTTSWKAINMYADFGFRPNMNKDQSVQAWRALNEICHRDFLALS